MDKLKHLLSKYSNELYLSGILFLSAFLRLDHTSLRPLWLDEADIANLLSVPLANSWSVLVNSAQNATYFYVLRTWSLCFGNSEMGIRSLSVFFSLLSIIVIYKFGVRLNGKKTGLWASFLLSVNYFSIFYAIQARQYSLVILLSILSYYYFYGLLNDFNYKKLTAYIFFTVFGVYSHPWFILILGSQFICLLFNSGHKKVEVIFSQVLIFILSVPWLIILWNHKIDGANNWIGLTKISTLFSTFHYFMYGATGVFIIGGIIACFFVLGRVEETETMINYRFNYFNYHQISSKIYLLFSYLFFPLFIAIAIGHFIPFYEPGRYEAVVLPAFILLFASLWSKIKSNCFASVLILLLIIFSYQEVLNEKKDIQNQKIDNRTTTIDFLANSQNGDWVVFTGLSRPPIDYYLTRFNSENKIFKEVSFPADITEHQAYQNNEKINKNLNQIKISSETLIGEIKKSSHGRVWLVFTQDNPIGPLLEKKFQENFTLDSYLPGPSFALILYKF
ncbi:MAG: glycosyltransferase family 39 protein [Patescibacteria group bacterium]